MVVHTQPMNTSLLFQTANTDTCSLWVWCVDPISRVFCRKLNRHGWCTLVVPAWVLSYHVSMWVCKCVLVKIEYILATCQDSMSQWNSWQWDFTSSNVICMAARHIILSTLTNNWFFYRKQVDVCVYVCTSEVFRNCVWFSYSCVSFSADVGYTLVKFYKKASILSKQM